MADVVVSDLPLITQATLDDVFIINDGNDTTSSITWANMLASIRQLQGQVLFDNGTESSPSISFVNDINTGCLLYTSPSPRDGLLSRMPSSA